MTWLFESDLNRIISSYMLILCLFVGAFFCVCLYLYEKVGDGYTGGLEPKMVCIYSA